MLPSHQVKSPLPLGVNPNVKLIREKQTLSSTFSLRTFVVLCGWILVILPVQYTDNRAPCPFNKKTYIMDKSIGTPNWDFNDIVF